MSKNTLTKDAKNLAAGTFVLCNKLTFTQSVIIHSRARKALDNLVANGYLEKISHREQPKGAEGWKSTNKMKELIKGKSVPDKKDLFPLTTE